MKYCASSTDQRARRGPSERPTHSPARITKVYGQGRPLSGAQGVDLDICRGRLRRLSPTGSNESTAERWAVWIRPPVANICSTRHSCGDPEPRPAARVRRRYLGFVFTRSSTFWPGHRPRKTMNCPAAVVRPLPRMPAAAKDLDSVGLRGGSSTPRTGNSLGGQQQRGVVARAISSPKWPCCWPTNHRQSGYATQSRNHGTAVAPDGTLGHHPCSWILHRRDMAAHWAASCALSMAWWPATSATPIAGATSQNRCTDAAQHRCSWPCAPSGCVA